MNMGLVVNARGKCALCTTTLSVLCLFGFVTTWILGGLRFFWKREQPTRLTARNHRDG